MNSKTSRAVDFGGKSVRFWSRGFVCQMKKVNACGHIPVLDLTMTYSVNSRRRTLIRGKSIAESLRGSILDSIIVEGGDPDQDFFQEHIPRLQIGLEFPNNLFQVRRRKECNHLRSPSRFEKQSQQSTVTLVFEFAVFLFW